MKDHDIVNVRMAPGPWNAPFFGEAVAVVFCHVKKESTMIPLLQTEDVAPYRCKGCGEGLTALVTLNTWGGSRENV